MPAHNSLNQLLLHNIRIASDVRDAASLLERTERSFDLAQSFCHGKGHHSSDVSWSFVEFVLGGDAARKQPSALPHDHIVIFNRLVHTRAQIRQNIGQLVSKIELQVPVHHTYPVPRAVWVGRLGHKKPHYELRRRGSEQFSVTMSTTVKDPYTGTGPIEHRYFGDSAHATPLETSKREYPVTTYGFILSASGVEMSDDQYPALVYGRDTLVSVVGHRGLNPSDEMNLQSCLNQIDPPIQ